MKRKALALTVILALLFVFSGCSSLLLETRGLVIAKKETEGRREYKTIKHFSRTEMARWTLVGTIPLMKPDLERIISEEIDNAEGDAVMNLRIKDEWGVVDMAIELGIRLTGLLSYLLFLGLPYLAFSSRTVIIEGDVIKYID